MGEAGDSRQNGLRAYDCDETCEVERKNYNYYYRGNLRNP